MPVSDHADLVSVVIPACDAEKRLPHAVRSLIGQSWTRWEAIIVADDSLDYRAILASHGLADARIRHTATGGHRTGCHRARNTGYRQAQGAFIADLDADDVFRPERLATLVPLAREHGAANDNPAVISDESGKILYRALNDFTQYVKIDAAALLALTCPLFPVVRRDMHRPRLEGIEYAEDVVSNLRLIGRLGALLAVPQTLSEYRVVSGSLSHDDRSAQRFDAGYADIIARIARGELDLPAALRDVAIEGFTHKRALNRALEKAQQENPRLDFQTFVAGLRTANPA